MKYIASALHHAVISGDFCAVKDALRKDNNANVRDSFGSYPVLDAIKLNRLLIVSTLIESGAELNVFDETGESPLSAAWASGDVQLLQLVLDALKGKDIDINVALDSPNRSLIHEDTVNPCSVILRAAGLQHPYA